ncbi:MAG TPA: Dyp-type peroxidase [Solirubrobacteraceae bacterium]|jgi:deferrochelatase/peroxidase EfeB|nr:Dyp-type peroxidase [Solirubrobacteraceae bacterium]
MTQGDANTKSHLDRRSFLTRAGIGAATVAGAGLLGQGTTADAAAGNQTSGTSASDPLQADAPIVIPRGDPTLAAVAFHGEHQAGITTPKPPSGAFASFNVTAESRAELIELLKMLTHTARFLATGGAAPAPTTYAPPADSGTLGATVPADGVTVTVGLGNTLFDERFGLTDQRPLRLKPMEPFPNDNLDPAQTGGDLLIQVCAGNPDTTLHAMRSITRATRGGLALNWRIEGFVPPPRPSGVSRNTFAFKDGIANPNVGDPDVARRLLWVTDGIGEPAWATGGSYHVVRIIKQFIEFWDRVSLAEQQQMIGRFRESGAPLDGKSEGDIPNYKADPLGYVIPLTAHIRLSNPRTKASEDSRIFRRGYNYDRGVDLNGNMDVGLVFNCFQQDLDRQFVANQTRLIGEPMVDYISPVGGGYFFAVPGVRDSNDWYASRLFA